MYNQDEPSGAHWDHEQITIHPTACFYPCLACGELVKEELIFITHDRQHDVNAVRVFQKKSIEHLISKCVKVKEIIEFTDHCSNQYKSKLAFFSCQGERFQLLDIILVLNMERAHLTERERISKTFVRKTVKSGMVLLTSCEDLAEYSRLKYDHQIPCSKMGKHDEKCRSSKENRNDGHSLMKVIYVKDIEKMKR